MGVLLLVTMYIMLQHSTLVLAAEEVACEHKSNKLLQLSCPAGTVIQINSAVYGRQSTEYCTNSASKMSNLNCAAENSLTIVGDACTGKTSCSIEAANSVFGDPCRGTTKYILADYECVAEGGVEVACEHQSSSPLQLSCPAGQVIKINSAVYGRQSTEYCTNDASLMSNLNCAAENSLTIVGDACTGEASCSVEAANSVFGDPCKGTTKYILANYSCVAVQEEHAGGCYPSASNGKSYNGTLSVTLNGHTCQHWNSLSLASPANKLALDANNFPDATLDAAVNYCRNPTYSTSGEKPWCYTTADPSPRWDYCDLDLCPAQNKAALGGHCTNLGSPCAAENSICKNYHCKCRQGKGFVKGGDTCVAQNTLELGAGCSDKGEACAAENSVCKRFSCRCKKGFVKQGDTCVDASTLTEIEVEDSLLLAGRCSAALEGSPCNAANSVCKKQRCKCKKGYTKENGEDNCMAQDTLELAAFCTKNGEPCAADNSVCRNRHCKCRNNFIMEGDTCVPQSTMAPETLPTPGLGLGVRCQPHRGPPCAPANSACITYRCKCNRYWVRDGEHCVEQITLPLAARCTTPDAPCADGNSECRAYRCFCKAGTVKIGNKCEVPSGY